MKKYIVSILIGLLSATGILTGALNQFEQDTINAVKIEENTAAEDLNTEDLVTDEQISDDINSDDINNEASLETNEDIEETIEDLNASKGNDERVTNVEETEPELELETEAKTVTPTKEKKQEKEVKIDSNKEIKSFYNELENCDEDTVYSKVIVNGKEYKDLDAETLLNNLVKQYGVNLNETNNKDEKKPEIAPPKEIEAETEAKETQPSNNSYAEQVLQLVNKERQAAGLSALTMDLKLKAAADKRAVETVSKFSHQRPDGRNFDTVLDEHGIKFNAAGENIAYGQPTPKSVVDGWMNSPGHRANILGSSFNKIGVGVYEQNGIIYWTQLFTN